MFGTVTAIIVLYLIGLVVARRFDKKDQEKVSRCSKYLSRLLSRFRQICIADVSANVSSLLSVETVLHE